MKKALSTLGLILSLCLLTRIGHSAPPNVFNLTPSNGNTAQLIATGQGTLFSLYISSGKAGEFAVCFDTSSASGINSLLSGTTNVPELMRVVITTTTANSTVSIGPLSGFMPPSVPIVNFTSGLGCFQSSASYTSVYYRQPQ